jgi:type IV pilus assembly protein PilN
MAKINLLPWREAKRQRRKNEFFISLLAGVLLTVALMFGWHFINERIRQVQLERIGRLNEEIAVVDKILEEIKDIDTTRQRLEIKINVIQTLQRSRPESVHLMDEMVTMMPDGVLLDKISQTGDNIEIEGKAQSNTRVSALMRNISESNWISTPRLHVIQNSQATEGGDNSFKLLFSLKRKESAQ